MADKPNEALIAWLPHLIYTRGKFESGQAVVCDAVGNVTRIVPVDE